MKGRFNMPTKKKLFRKDGITLMELMIVIALIGLIFGLGIYPVLSQLQLFKAERSEVALFDDANLVVYYITKDAMMAQAANDSTPNEITFTINAVSLDTGVTDPSLRDNRNVRYYASGTELRREYQAAYTVITKKLAAALPTFVIDPDGAGQQLDRLECNISFQDPDNTNLTTTRAFEVMLRSRDAQY